MGSELFLSILGWKLAKSNIAFSVCMNFEVQLALKVVFRPGFIVREANLKRRAGFPWEKNTNIYCYNATWNSKILLYISGRKKGKENNSLSLTPKSSFLLLCSLSLSQRILNYQLFTSSSFLVLRNWMDCNSNLIFITIYNKN